MYWIKTSILSPCLLALSVISAAASPQPPDNAFDRLKTYDFQNRTPADAISEMIKRANGDKQQLVSIETKLDGVLEDPSATFGGKQEACRLLSTIGTGVSVPALSSMLADEKTADIARYALERDPAPSSARALRLAVGTTTGKTQIGVINSLGNRADPIAPGVLKKYLHAAQPEVSEAVIAALGKIGNPAAIALLKSLPESNIDAGNALLRAAGQLAAAGAVPAALAMYESLAVDGRPAIVRAEAMRGLSVLNSPHAAIYALAALRSTDTYLQEVAARVIGTIGTGPAVNPAIEMWPNLPPPLQIVLLTGFADRRDKSALPIAFTAMDSKDAALRSAGMRSAALIGGPTVVTRLIEFLTHGEGDDRNVARDCLGSMPGVEAERNILQAARTAAPDVRAALMPVLALRSTSGALALIVDSAGSADRAVAVQALQALGRIGKPLVFGEILRVLVATRIDDVRDAAKDAAGAIAPKVQDHGSDKIFAALELASPPARAALYPIVAEIGTDRALSVLVKSSASTGDLRLPAINALSDNWPDSRAMPTLLAIAQTEANKSIKIQALRGFLRLLAQDDKMDPDNRVTSVLEALDVAVRPEEKRQALSVLRDCRVISAVEAAAKMLDDPELFNDAANTILYLAAKQRKNDHDQAPVTGDAANSALDKIIGHTKDSDQKAAAQKLRG